MSTSDSSQFYAGLPLMENFFEASDERKYHPLPPDWHVAVTDIVDSSSAIASGRYKTVNLLGASPIMGILNLAGRHEIPYIFAGDGSAFCIPPALLEDARKVLGASRKIGKAEFGLDLRAAVIPVSFIRRQGHDIRIARYAVSDVYIQAVFSGGGLTYAEELLKTKTIKSYRVPALDNAEAVDFSGLECRWQEVKQEDKEVITLLAKANPQRENPADIYEQLMQEMSDIFGFDDKTNPLKASRLSMNTGISKLFGEIKFRTFGKGWIGRIVYVLKMQFQIILGKMLMALNYETSATDWSQYKSDMVRNSDHRKFDDMLRVVISGTSRQRRKLEKVLENKFSDGSLAFGVHISEAAMITCMVFRYHREHVHFVDGKNGGYVAASKELKRRLKKLKDRKTAG